MAFTLYDSATLLEVRRKQESIPVFWQRFFNRQINFDTQFIDFEVVSRKYRKLAPFVAPTAQGRVVRTQGSNMKRFSPAYIKMKAVIDPSKVVARQVGEFTYRNLSLAQKRDAVIAEELREHKTRLDNRQEWLASKAIIDGKVIIAGEDYPTQLVDFGRDPSLDMTLSGAALWSAGTATPLTDIRTLRKRVMALAAANVNDIIFGQDAWDAFAQRMAFNAPTTGNLLDKTYNGSNTDITRFSNGYEGVEYMGRLQGREDGQGFNCWVYSGFYEDDTGAAVDFMSPKEIVGVSSAVDGVKCYGAIMDAQAGYQAMSVHSKNWIQEDPSFEYILTQSAPLLVPAEPNATFRAKVLA